MLHTVFSQSDFIKYKGSAILQCHTEETEVQKGEDKNETHGIYLEMGV